MIKSDYGLSKGRATTEQVKSWESLIAMNDEEFESALDTVFPSGRQTQPSFWNNEAFNNPAQPVVGICWYEACAYCVWLSVSTGQDYHLSTEAQWEAAARGLEARSYAYGGNYDSARCNTFETHIRRTTPIGIFPSGKTPQGVTDLTGNTWDWTRSAYQSYPYKADAGRENLIATDDTRRVCRGSSWLHLQALAQASYRFLHFPNARSYDLGFRIVCNSPLLN